MVTNVMKQAEQLKQVDKALIRFGDWTKFNDLIDGLPKEAFETEKAFCKALELDENEYNRIISRSAWNWVDSPSKSLLNGMGFNGLSRPTEGSLVFDNFISQTRFILMLINDGFMSRFAFENIKDENGKKLSVKGEFAQTLREGREKRFNNILQIIYAYFAFCRAKESQKELVKPKKLYRGIRLTNAFNVPVIREMFSNNNEKFKDKNYSEVRKLRVDLLIDYIKTNGFNDICESNLVSFTSSKAIAKYFANKEGILIEVNSNDVEIMTSGIHDERFSGKDFVSGKDEKEYIVRISDKRQNANEIIIHDLDYFIETNNPLAVNLFDHDDKSATYELNGTRIKAYLVWTSNTSTSIRYKNLTADSWGYSSKEFKDRYGFSPVLSGKTIKEVKDFIVYID